VATLELKNVKKSYGKVDVIHGIDLQIDSGDFCVFVGPSGCGKSTLLRMIAGLEPITNGEVLKPPLNAGSQWFFNRTLSIHT